MANNRYRCPNCRRRENRVRRENNTRTEVVNIPNQQEILPGSCPGEAGVFSCGAGNPVAAQLYGAICEPAVYRECCDPQCGCRIFDACARDPFWPSFAHPRWLGCEELYIIPAYIKKEGAR